MVHETTPVAEDGHPLILERNPKLFYASHVHKPALAKRLANVNIDSNFDAMATKFSIWGGVNLFDFAQGLPYSLNIRPVHTADGKVMNLYLYKDAVSNLVSSTDLASLGLYRPIRYLSKDHDPCERILCVSASSIYSIKTALELRSRISEFCIECHILLRVRDRASILALCFVKSFATRTLLLHCLNLLCIKQ